MLYTLVTPVNVGTVTTPRTIKSLALTGVEYTSTPDLAPIGAGVLRVTLTDPDAGFQEVIDYRDASVIEMWEKIGDTIGAVVFDKLVADGKLPPGTTDAAPAMDTASGGK